MNSKIFGIVFFLPLIAILVRGEDEIPIKDVPPAMLANAIQSMAVENVMSARVNVAHDVARKRIRIFSVVAGGKTGEFSESHYDLEIIYNASIASSKVGVGSYHFQHDNQVLSFAAAQFASGNKLFARRLVGLLANAEPDLFWSTPTHQMTIQQILVGLEKDDDTVRDFVKDKSEDWADTVKSYGP